jgi:hypothetical protein
LKLLLDEMYPAVIAEALRDRGHDVVAVVERSGLRNLADAALFAVAQAEQRAVVTENLDDFSGIANGHDRRAERHYGVVLVVSKRYPRGRPRTIGRMVTALAQLAERFPADEPASRRHWL